MAKRKTDDGLRAEIALGSRNAREFLSKSREIHKQARRAELATEQIRVMNSVIEFQRTAIRQAKKVMRLEKVLYNRQLKMMRAQLADVRRDAK